MAVLIPSVSYPGTCWCGMPLGQTHYHDSSYRAATYRCYPIPPRPVSWDKPGAHPGSDVLAQRMLRGW